MATTQPKKGGKKGGRRRVYLALGLVALVIVGYILYSRSKGSTATGTSPFSTGSATDQYPASSDTGGGSGSGSADQSGTDPTAAFLSTLAGENQQLIGALLGGGQSQQPAPSVGAPQPTVAEPNSTFAQVSTAATPAPAAAASSSVPASVGGFVSYPSIDFTTPSPAPASQGTVDLTPAPGVPATVGGFTSEPEITFTPPASTVQLSPTRSSPANPSGLSGNKKQGVISVH